VNKNVFKSFSKSACVTVFGGLFLEKSKSEVKLRLYYSAL